MIRAWVSSPVRPPLKERKMGMGKAEDFNLKKGCAAGSDVRHLLGGHVVRHERRAKPMHEAVAALASTCLKRACRYVVIAERRRVGKTSASTLFVWQK